jgi:hypothetical protein
MERSEGMAGRIAPTGSFISKCLTLALASSRGVSLGAGYYHRDARTATLERGPPSLLRGAEIRTH